MGRCADVFLASSSVVPRVLRTGSGSLQSDEGDKDVPPSGRGRLLGYQAPCSQAAVARPEIGGEKSPETLPLFTVRDLEGSRSGVLLVGLAVAAPSRVVNITDLRCE